MRNFAMISLEELKFVAPRVALYTAVAYVTIRTVSSVVKNVSRLTGLGDDK